MSGEKSEKPTPKRLRKAREEGNVPMSQEFTSTVVAVSALVTLVFTSSTIGMHLTGYIRNAIRIASRPTLDTSLIGPLLFDGLFVIAHVIGPVVAVAFVMAAFIAYVQIGPVFAVKALMPDTNRLNPFNGLKNMFNKAKLVELAKNLGKLTVMIGIGWGVYDDQIARLLRTPRVRLIDAMAIFRDAAFDLAKFLVGGLIAFAVLDLIWKRHKHQKDLMMSKQEVKDEHKESEGDPHIKGKRKQMHRQLIQDAGMSQVKNADAVVANPTHVAVAVRYREEEMQAPKVVAKGKGEIARKIRRLARRYDVPIVRNVPLARALVETDLEDEIPEELYEGVAEVLRFVYSMSEET